jgi:hypothetical protein
VSVVGRVQINHPGAAGAVLPPTIPDDPPPEDGGGSYLDLISADGAEAVWPLSESDGTSTYADVVGTANGAVTKGVTSDWASSPIGPSTTASPLFNGSATFNKLPDDLCIVIPHNSVFEVGTGDFSIESWFLGGVFPDDGIAFTVALLSTPGLSSYFFADLQGPTTGSDYGQFRFADAAEAAATDTIYDDHALHHLVFTRDSGTYFAIIDGAEVASHTPTTPIAVGTTEEMYLAGLHFGEAFDVYTLKGQIAWCAWYRNALTESQAAAHFAAGS